MSVKISDRERELRQELDMLDVAKYLLEKKGEVVEFNELLVEVVDFLGYEEDQMNEQMAQFYTDLNTDGQFISLGDNHWGLRSWYPIDSINEVITDENTAEDITPKKNKDGFDDYDSFVEEFFMEDEEITEDKDLDDDDADDVELQDDEIDEDDLDAYRDDLDDLETSTDELDDIDLEDDELMEEDEDEDL